MPLEALKKDQHCILFSSQNPKIHELTDCFQIASLNASLRSTCEIIHFVENFRKDFSLTKNNEIECKTANNFHGEPVDVRTCNDESDFAQKSVMTIEEYLEHSRGLAFLPVILHVPEDLLSSISSSLNAKQIKNDFCESLYRETSDTTVKTLPSVYFFNIHCIEGLEFAVVVFLLYDNRSYESGLKFCFHEIITRACTKLVIVYAMDKTMEKVGEKKQTCLASATHLEQELKLIEPNSLVFLIGPISNSIL